MDANKSAPPAHGAKAKKRAPRNRTLTLEASDVPTLSARLLTPDRLRGDNHIGRTIHGDCAEAIDKLPSKSIDLLVLDPPYNLNKHFGSKRFSRRPVDEYTAWLDDLLTKLVPLLKPTASIYICGDWLSSASIFTAASNFFTVRNRITWEREKGRGALTNWKNASEDIWFCTMSDDYTFNVEDVKVRRRVIAPYRHADGKPKDWQETTSGNFRDTHPSNLWTDITIPFWSMPENTDHPTQKSEKLIAKLILASTNSGDIVFDPFLGSGTSSVVAKKLGRHFCGIEIEEEYALLAEKRLALADSNSSIQGYTDYVFWERNTLNVMNGSGHDDTNGKGKSTASGMLLPFD